MRRGKRRGSRRGVSNEHSNRIEILKVGAATDECRSRGRPQDYKLNKHSNQVGTFDKLLKNSYTFTVRLTKGEL